MEENLIVRKKDELVPREDGSTEPVYRKVLKVIPGMAGFDVDGMLAKLMQYANMADALSHVERTLEYVVQIPIKHREAFEAGEVFLNENTKTGVLWPTLYETLENGKRKFVDNLPIKQEEIIHGNPFESMAVSYHNLYMQQQIAELADALQETYQAVRRIEQGQMDDRIGLLIAGRDQIRFSLNASPEERIAAMAQGRGNLLVAQKQLLQTFKSRVNGFEPLPEGSFSRFRMELMHAGAHRRRDQEFMEIQQYYALYLQATQMVAASYAICGQMDAAEQVFIEAEMEMKEIDFGALQTLRYIHKKNTEMFYYHAADYITTEREICLEEAQEYDAISLQVTGAKLLEVFEDGRTKEISEADSEQ
jgi:hypothetical protein